MVILHTDVPIVPDLSLVVVGSGLAVRRLAGGTYEREAVLCTENSLSETVVSVEAPVGTPNSHSGLESLRWRPHAGQDLQGNVIARYAVSSSGLGSVKAACSWRDCNSSCMRAVVLPTRLIIHLWSILEAPCGNPRSDRFPEPERGRFSTDVRAP